MFVMQYAFNIYAVSIVVTNYLTHIRTRRYLTNIRTKRDGCKSCMYLEMFIYFVTSEVE